MSTTPKLTIVQKNLFQQGFQSYTRHELTQLNIGLRFTPLLCMVIGAIGLLTHNLYILSSVAAIGIIAAFFPSKHPFDIFFNQIFRHVIKAETLPPNPLQRRLACLGAGFINASIAMLFLFDTTTSQIPLSEVSFSMAGLGSKAQVAYYLGAVLIFMQVIVFINHFCFLSWGYEKLMNLMGIGDAPISVERAQRLQKMGVSIIDVRNAESYAIKHVAGAINVPLENLKNSDIINKLSDEAVLIYCHTGKLSHIAQEIFRKNGVSLAYNLGSMARAKEILAV